MGALRVDDQRVSGTRGRVISGYLRRMSTAP
jgi:hypothetical protein